MRLALPVLLAASSSTTFWKCASTGALASTSDSGALSGRPASSRTLGVGNTMAPTSFMFRPVSTTSWM